MILTLNPVELLHISLLGAVLAIATVTDLWKQKIYNWLTFPAIAAGVILNFCVSGWHGLLAISLEGLLVGSVWILIFIFRGATGAGDLKLLQAVGAIMGPAFTGYTLLYTALAGGVFGVIQAMRRGVLGDTIKNALLGAHVLAAVQSTESLTSMADQSKAGKIAYAPAVAIGALFGFLVTHHIL